MPRWRTSIGDPWLRLIGPAVLLTACLVMLAWTWRTWPDPFVDNGQQVYIPWRLTAGETLYRDIAFYNGPFSQYFTALAFRVGGISLNSYFSANLLVLGLFLSVAYYGLRQVAGRVATTLACLVFVLLFAFAQFDTVTGYNWVAPYASEGPQGLLLGLSALVAAWRYPEGGRCWILVSGLLVGTALLTKGEIALGGLAAVVVALGLTHYTARATAGAMWRSGGLFLLACLLPWTVAVGLLSTRMPLTMAVEGALGSWKLVFSSDVNTLTFHRLNMGLLNPGLQLRMIAIASVWYAAVLVPAAVIGLCLRRPGRANVCVLGLLFCVVGIVALRVPSAKAWLMIGLPLSAAMLLLATTSFALWLKRPRDEPDSSLQMRQLTLAVFALGALAKIVLNSRIHHYGFVHAAPAAMVLVVAVWDWLPKAINRYGGNGNAIRCAVVPPLVLCCAYYLTLQSMALKRFDVVVANGPDSFYSDQRGDLLNAVLEELSREMAPRDTLAALPASCMLNYLARRATTVPYTQITPTELATYGEETILASFERHPPDWIALVHFDGIEFGQRFFGHDFGQAIASWIVEHYEPRAQFGATPFTSDEFGIVLWKRTSPGSLRQETRGP